MTDTGVKGRAPGWVPDVSTFGARLALVRQAMGWGNVAEAAKACDLPIGSWRNWERDGREPRGLLNVAIKIAGVTGVDYRWLAMGPVDENLPTAERVGKSTREYSTAVGQRVVAVGSGVPPVLDHPNVRSVRTRPLRGSR